MTQVPTRVIEQDHWSRSFSLPYFKVLEFANLYIKDLTQDSGQDLCVEENAIKDCLISQESFNFRFYFVQVHLLDFKFIDLTISFRYTYIKIFPKDQLLNYPITNFTQLFILVFHLTLIHDY